MKKFLYTLMFPVVLAAFVAGCEQEGPAEEAGENIDEAVEEAGEKVEEAGDAVEDKMKN